MYYFCGNKFNKLFCYCYFNGVFRGGRFKINKKEIKVFNGKLKTSKPENVTKNVFLNWKVINNLFRKVYKSSA